VEKLGRACSQSSAKERETGDEGRSESRSKTRSHPCLCGCVSSTLFWRRHASYCERFNSFDEPAQKGFMWYLMSGLDSTRSRGRHFLSSSNALVPSLTLLILVARDCDLFFFLFLFHTSWPSLIPQPDPLAWHQRHRSTSSTWFHRLSQGTSSWSASS
jgi:hypothetical protein